MPESKAHIISRLQKDILLMQGFIPVKNGQYNDKCLQCIRHAFPNSRFPFGVVHEFFCDGMETNTASSGFIGGIISTLMKKGGVSVWISSSQTIFPPSLKSFGIHPEKMIFIYLKKEREKLWAMKESLKCDGVCAVIGEIDEISFIESRQLQLAVEHSKVTGFLVRRNPKNLSTTCVTRWKIKSINSSKETDGLPGLNFPSWNVDLIKVRNGKPGSWQMKWRKRQFELIQQDEIIVREVERKVV